MESTTPLDRCIAVPGEHHFVADFFFKQKCVRPMPTYAIPGVGARL